MAVPLDAVYTVGNKCYAFIPDGESARPVVVEVGQNNETHVEITSGIIEGLEGPAPSGRPGTRIA